jgi:transposase
MIAQHILAPKSKLGITSVWDDTTLAQELQIDTKKENTDSLYAAMDWLLKRQDKIEQKLARRHLSEEAMPLYDISSSYVEGECCPLAMFGHNRDKKDGKKIIVYGLLTDEMGRPISIQAYPGNTADSTTIPDQVTKIRDQFGLHSVTLVGDRGMLTGTQIEKLKQYRVRSHFLICMLSYYVVWHLRMAWRDIFCDENIEKTRANRNPVETAKPDSHLKAKKANYKKIKSTVTSNSNVNISQNPKQSVKV